MTIQSNVLTGQVAKWTLDARSYSNSKDEVIFEHKNINYIIREIANENNVVVADVAEKFNTLKTTENRILFYRPEDAWDDFHPNDEGSEVIAEELFRAIYMNFSAENIETVSYPDK